jgi:hypothetical protein
MAELLLNPCDLRSRLERDPGEGVTEGMKGAIAAVLTLAGNARAPHRRVEHLAYDVVRVEMPPLSFSQDISDAPGRIRTSDPRIRSPPLCPLSYGRMLVA